MNQAANPLNLSCVRHEKVLSESQKIKGAVDAFPVFGSCDAMVLIEAESFDELKEAAKQVNAIKETKSTETLPEPE